MKTFDLAKFCKDLSTLRTDIYSFYLGEVPLELSAAEVLAELKKIGLLEKLPSPPPNADDTLEDGLYFLSIGNSYSVFLAERGLKHWSRTFDSLESASNYWLEILIPGLKKAEV